MKNLLPTPAVVEPPVPVCQSLPTLLTYSVEVRTEPPVECSRRREVAPRTCRLCAGVVVPNPILPALSVSTELPMAFVPVNLAILPVVPCPVMEPTACGVGDEDGWACALATSSVTSTCSTLLRSLPLEVR